MVDETHEHIYSSMVPGLISILVDDDNKKLKDEITEYKAL